MDRGYAAGLLAFLIVLRQKSNLLLFIEFLFLTQPVFVLEVLREDPFGVEVAPGGFILAVPLLVCLFTVEE